MKLNKVKLNIIAICLLISLLLYQNCAQTEFTVTTQGEFQYSCEQDASFSKDCVNRAYDVVTKSYTATPTDVLFVLDDSCSMQHIADAVNSGFESLSNATFPDNTKMALTYMSPSNVLADGTVDYTKAWESLKSESVKEIIKILPGHMDLVNKQKIDEFKSKRAMMVDETNYNIKIEDFQKLYPSINIDDPVNGIFKHVDGIRIRLSKNSKPTSSEYRIKEHLSQLAIEGCSNSWFSPNDKNANGQSCLRSVTQLANVCTGAEAGLLSLEQMLNLKTSQNIKVFRDNALVNIILVSDTHEAGDNYFGTPGAPQSMASLSHVYDAIMKNNPTVSSIKFSGIVPLPPEGSEKLDGLNIVGEIPKTMEESKVGSEALYDFSYLPYIKDTNGIVAHASNRDWTLVASKIIDESHYTGNISVELSAPAKKLINVKVNGVDIDLSRVELSENRKTIYIKYAGTRNTQLKVEVDYGKDSAVSIN